VDAMTETTTEQDRLAERFEVHRPHLRAVAYRMLGSVSEAEDAVQETWIRLSRTDTMDLHDLRAWLTTVVSRVCLNQLRTRRTRREGPLDAFVADPIVSPEAGIDPEQAVLLADAIGLALLAVLETLSPAERVAFVLHDVFAVPFDDIAPIVGRTSSATRQLASRGRRRVQGVPTPDTDLEGQWAVVDAFLAASRDGDFERLLTILDPDVVLRADGGTGRPAFGQVVRGREAVASNAMTFRKLAARALRTLVNGVPGGVVRTPDGRPFAVLAFTVARGRILEIDVLADSDRLATLDLPAPSG
jgi:RNA polymerase sigma factor (sigma-70 family)